MNFRELKDSLISRFEDNDEYSVKIDDVDFEIGHGDCDKFKGAMKGFITIEYSYTNEYLKKQYYKDEMFKHDLKLLKQKYGK